MPDQLRDRFDALRSAVERTEAAGLHDVRVRRTRRARTRLVAGSAAAVAAFALAGVVVLPQLQADNNTTSAGGAQVLSDADEALGSGSTGTDDQAAEQVPDEGAAEVPPAEQAPPEDAAGGPFAVTVESLLTWDDIEAVGETGSGALPYGASLVFPPLCGSGNSYQQYSVPVAVYSAAWELSDARFDQAAIEYESDQQAVDAMTQLVETSQSCPLANEFASIQFVGSDAGVGSEIAFFDLLLESGQDGSVMTAAISVTRIANVLVEVVLTPDGPLVADADSRSRALAQASVDRIVAIG